MTRNTVSLLAPPYTLEKTRRESSIRSVFSSSSKSLQLKHLPLLPSSLSFLSFRHSCLSCQRRKILDHPFFSFPSSSSSRLSSSNSFSSCRSRTSSFFFSPPCPSSTSSSFPLFSRTSSLTLSSLHSRFHLSFRLFFPPLSETLNDCLHPFRDQPQRQWIATSSLQPGRKGRKRERRHIERKEEKSLYVTKLVENHQKNGESLQRKKEGKFSFSQSPPSSLSSSASSSSSWSSSSSDSSSHPSSSRSPLSPSSSSAHSRISGEGFSRHSQSSRDDIEEKLETVSSSVCSLDQQEDVSLVDWGESSPLPTKASISSYKEKPRSFSYAPESGTRVDKINTNERGKNPNEEEEKKEESESRMKRSKEEEEERGKEEDPDGANDPGVERRVTPLTWASSDAKKLLYSETVDENSSAGIDRDLSHPVSYVGEPLDFDSYETSRSSHLSSVRSLSRDPDGPLSFSISPSSSLSSSSTLSSSSSSPSFSSSFSSSLPSSPSSTSSKVSYDRHDTPLHSPRHLNKSFEEEGRHEESSSHLVFSSVFSSLHRSLLTCLLRGGSGIITPTDVQERSIPLLLKGSSSLVLSPTGSGKTFAWMLPLLHRLIVSDKEKLAPFPQQPRSIILIPTRELGQQILTQLRRFSSVITSGVCTAGQSYVKEVRMLQKGVDVIVCTPARLMLHLHKHNLNMRRVMSMVIEEADTLCDSFFEQELTFLLSFFPHHSSASSFSSSFLDESSPAISSSSSFKHRLLPINSRQVPSSSKDVDRQRSSSSLCNFLGDHVEEDEHDTSARDEINGEKRGEKMRRLQTNSPQLVLVAATKTGALGRYLRENLSRIHISSVCTPDAHLTASGVQQVFVSLHGQDRMSRLIEVLEENVGNCEKSKTMIFCNTVNTCRAVDLTLLEKGYKVSCLHGMMPFKLRKSSFQKFKDGVTNILVCTNVASRGLEIEDVQHVIMFDFPQTLADYLHRCGRTARGGEMGRVTLLFAKRNLPLIQQIQNASRAAVCPPELRHATPRIRRILRLEERWRELIDMRNPKRKIGGRRKLRLPPHRNTAGPKTKWATKQLYFRLKAWNHLKFLRSRGILRKKELLPRHPRQSVERSDAQQAMKVIRGDDGFLQMLPVRRSRAYMLKQARESEEGDYEDPSTTVPIEGALTYEAERAAKPAKHHRRTYF